MSQQTRKRNWPLIALYIVVVVIMYILIFKHDFIVTGQW